VRRVILGVIPLIASIVIPATFRGTVYLIVLWLLVGLGGLYLLLTARPIKRRWIAALRRELDIAGPAAPPGGESPDRTSELAAEQQLARSEIEEELEAAHDVLYGPNRARFFAHHDLATFKWERYGPVIGAADPALHKRLRAAYRAMDAVNNRGVTRGVVTSGGRDTALLDGQLMENAQDALDRALKTLEADKA